MKPCVYPTKAEVARVMRGLIIAVIVIVVIAVLAYFPDVGARNRA